jgi:hypothetical protein
MCSTEYGTDYELYLGTGIVKISQLKPHHNPDPLYSESRICRLKKERLEDIFKHKICKPWLPENHIIAEITRAQWENKVTTEFKELKDGKVYPHYQFQGDSMISILKGVSRAEVTRTSMASGIMHTFGPQEPSERWWVVDFLQGGMLGSQPRDSTQKFRYG